MSNDNNFGPWVDWAGGECPIPDAKAGEWQYRTSGLNFTAENPACSLVYKPHWEAGTIIAYRVRIPADALLRQATEALRNIANSDVPRPVATTFRSDGAASKHDKCAHDVAMYEDCGNCIAEYARTVLAATVLTAYDKRSA